MLPYHTLILLRMSNMIANSPDYGDLYYHITADRFLMITVNKQSKFFNLSQFMHFDIRTIITHSSKNIDVGFYFFRENIKEMTRYEWRTGVYIGGEKEEDLINTVRDLNFRILYGSSSGIIKYNWDIE